MICQHCRKAGELNKQLNQQYSSTLRRRIMLWHDKCAGAAQCNCQHVIGQVINLERIN